MAMQNHLHHYATLGMYVDCVTYKAPLYSDILQTEYAHRTKGANKLIR